jgi:hypothetical protein
VGGYTHKAGKHFHVRKEFADEGEKHAVLILAGVGGLELLPAGFVPAQKILHTLTFVAHQGKTIRACRGIDLRSA